MLLAVIFRLLPRFGVTNLYAIVINYFTCFSVGSLIHGAPTVHTGITQETWFPYALFLSLTFILFFNVNAYTIQKVGMVVTSVFQKLSLVAPAMLGIVMFGESGSFSKYLALVLTLVAILMISYTSKSDEDLLEKMKQYWFWPILVFAGSALIEMVLFYAQETGKVTDAGLVFTSDLFFMAGCWGLLFIILRRRFDVTWRDVLAGIAIGIPNFFTIYLIMVGLENGWDGSVLFPMNNVGVIFVASLVGIFVFKEKMNLVNILGLAVAILAVYLISS